MISSEQKAKIAQRSYISDVYDPTKKDERHIIFGWIHRIRATGKIIFCVVRDHTGIIQIVVEKKVVGDEDFRRFKKAKIESSVIITGICRPDPRAPSGFELHANEVSIVNYADTFPITKDQSEEFLRDNRHLWLRSRKLTSAMKIRSTVFNAIHKFFRERGFYEWSPPMTTPNDSEGGSDLFTIQFYDKEMYLTQSWQLYAETALFSLEKIYDIAPSWRAEKSRTPRHLAEFWQAEMEAIWYDLDDLVNCAEEEIKFIIKMVLDFNRDDLKVLNARIEDLENIVSKPFVRMTYDEAVELLKNKKNMDVKWGKDLRTIEENELTALFDTPVIVTHYPKNAMAFYKPIDKEITNTPEPVARCFDVLAPWAYGEIIGGSERGLDINELINSLEMFGEKKENYKWYLDTRLYGSVPHGGYGMGADRVVRWICNLENIIDAIPFPRTLRRYIP